MLRVENVLLGINATIQKLRRAPRPPPPRMGESLGELSTKEITETRNDKTSVHRVGPLAGLSAIVFWGAITAFIFTVVAIATQCNLLS